MPMPPIWEFEDVIYAKGHLTLEELKTLYLKELGVELPKGKLTHEWLRWVPNLWDDYSGDFIGYPAEPHSRGAAEYVEYLP